ncbi:MAG: preprotein translocase subunit SecG [Planctomycetota bacterium]|jgi:protein translocase SecG subunit
MSVLPIIATVVYVIACLFLIMVVLLRKSEGSSLGSAFGVGGESPFGVKTQQALDKVAIYATIVFFGIAIFLSMYPRYIAPAKEKEETPAEKSSE